MTHFNKKIFLNIIITTMIFFGLSLITILIGEVIVRNSFRQTLEWIFLHFNSFLINGLIVLPVIVILSIFFKAPWISFFIVGLFDFGMAVASYQIQFCRDEYFNFQDFALALDTASIAEHIDFVKTKEMYFSFFVLIAITILLRKIKLNINFITKKIWVYVIFLILIEVLIIFTVINDNICRVIFKITISKTHDIDNFKNNGYLFTFFNKTKQIKIHMPKDYSEEKVNSILKNIETSNKSVKPNIIVIMNESFFDPLTVDGLKLNKDPIEYFRKLQNEYVGGTMISPMHGGGTSQPEFESLTGNSVDLFCRDNNAFLKYVKYSPFIGLPMHLISEGYSAIGIHPFEKEVYNREEVYKYLGFSNFYDQQSFINPTYPREYISDEDAYKKLINTYETRDQTMPFYANVVTMQNHTGYLNGELYDKKGVEVLNNNISNDDKIMMTNYLNLAKDSDDEFKDLIGYFESVKHPTIIIMFGDHQPSHNIGFDKIDGIGMSIKTNEQYLKIYQTPFVMWNNYGLSSKKLGYLDSSYISAILLDYIGDKSNIYFNYLYDCYKNIPAFNEEFYVDKNQNVKNMDDITIDEKKQLEDMKILQYDRIFGEKYINKIKN